MTKDELEIALLQVQEIIKVLDNIVADYESQFRSCVMHSVLLAQAFVPAIPPPQIATFPRLIPGTPPIDPSGSYVDAG